MFSVLHGLADVAKTSLLCMVKRRDTDVDMYFNRTNSCACARAVVVLCMVLIGYEQSVRIHSAFCCENC